MEVRALLDLGDVAKATRKLDDLAERVGWRWRLVWFRAVSELLTADYDSATKHFTEVLDTLPGELAPKLALAATAELAGELLTERKFYNTVWSTDHGVISAGFGLARAQSAEGERDAAVRTLDEVPGHVKAFHDRTIDERGDAAVRPVDQRGHRAAHPQRRPPGGGAARHRAAGAADPGAGAGHRDGLARGQHREHQPHPRVSRSPSTVCSSASRRRCAASPGSRPPRPTAMR